MSGKRRSFGIRVVLALGMVILAGFFLYQGMGQAARPSPSADPSPYAVLPSEKPTAVSENAGSEAASPGPSMPDNTPVPQESTLPRGEAASEPEQAEPLPQEQTRPVVYDERSYQLVTDMVYAFRKQLEDREQIIAADVQALKEHDAALGEAWGGIMEYWDYADNRLELNYETLPETLPRDGSLCIVVLGFQLLPEGGMSQEMLGRCKLALTAARQYPQAYLAVTGGGTAVMNAGVTEADVMAHWFLEQGIDEDRIIVEDRSSTTEENAKFTLKILTEQYPQIRSLAIVTSDYHVPLGCTLFTEAALLYGCEHGRIPWTVDAHVALTGYGLAEYTNPEEQALYIWALANPQKQ